MDTATATRGHLYATARELQELLVDACHVPYTRWREAHAKLVDDGSAVIGVGQTRYAMSRAEDGIWLKRV